MTGRPRNEVPTRKVEPRLPAATFSKLEQLVEIGTYGDNPTEVARYLIIRGIDDLIRAQVLRIEE